MFCFLFLFCCIVISSVSCTTATQDALNSIGMGIANYPAFASQCSPSAENSITQQLYLNTTQGQFFGCIANDQAAITFIEINTQQLWILATFEDFEMDSFTTRTIYTGNWCAEMGKSSGSNCYSQVMGSLANSFFPRWASTEVATDAVVSNWIASVFSPQTSTVVGVPSRCFSNTGKFALNGVQDRQYALIQRNFGYGGCDNSQGDNRFWTGVLWFWPSAFGTLLIYVGAFVVAVIAGIGGCCCGPLCAR